jgi:hypothetical protein
MEQQLVDFYSCLLAWLPRGFRDEFGEEMVQVFASRVQEAGLCGGRAVCRTLVGELLALPGLWLLAVQRERSILTVNNPDASAAPNGPATRGPASWSATLAAGLPLVGFIGAISMTGTVRRLLDALHLQILFHLLWRDAIRAAAMPMVFYLLLLGGLLVAWLKGFPRWSYPYLGWLPVFLISGVGISGLDDPYLPLIWGPLLITLLLAILLRPSLEPLSALWRSWRQDWTLSGFAVLGILEFLVWGSFDEMPGPRDFWQSVSVAVLVVGALGYMRASGTAGRVAALLGSAVLGVALSAGVNAYYWHGVHKSPMAAPANGYTMLSHSLRAWAGLSVVLMAPALISAALKVLLPRRKVNDQRP